MKLPHYFEITPPRETAHALAEAYQRTASRVPGKKLRRTIYPVKGKYGRIFAEVTLIESGESSDFQGLTVECKIDFSAWLMGPGAFTDNVFARPAAMFLPWLKSWLQNTIPSVSAEVLATLTEDHARLTHFTAAYFFDAGSSTEAFNWYISLLRHCKVLLDSRAPYPGTKKRTLPLQSRMVLSDACRQGFEVDLEYLPLGEVFGKAQIFLLLDHQDQPEGFSHSEFRAPEMLRQKARNLMCMAVTVDISKPLRFGKTPDPKLPSDFRQWTTNDVLDEPARSIFEAMRYALWLNLPMTTQETQVDTQNWTVAAKEVLNLYFAGGNLRQSIWITTDEEFLKYRRQMIRDAHVDILVPWAIARLNMSAFLENKLGYDDRFLPGDDADLAGYTLCGKNVDAPIAVLQEQLKGLAAKHGQPPSHPANSDEKKEAGG